MDILECDKLAADLITKRLRPFPVGHSLPPWVKTERHRTRCAYEGEPRMLHVAALPQVEEQDWAPAWADHIVRVFAFSLGDRESPEELKLLRMRDHILRVVAGNPRRAKEVEDVCALGGYDAVAQLLGFEKEEPPSE